MSRIAGPSGACASGNEKEGEKQSKSLRARGFHKKRAFNHLDRNCKCKMREEKREEVSEGNVGGPQRAENPPLDIDIQEISQRDVAFFS